MRPEDRKEFNNLLITAMAVYERQITSALGDLFFAALGVYSIDQVREGVARHIQDPVEGKFSPKPADIIRQINNVISNDGRPGKDEAWSIALSSQDEQDTVLITEEILAALAVAQPLLDMRDKVAARLAFVEAYERQVALSRRGTGKPAKWIVSLGDDKNRRAHAVQEGLRSGRLTLDQGESHLARIGQENQPIAPDASVIAGLLAGPKTKEPLTPEQLRERWQQVRTLVTDRGDVLAEKSMGRAMARKADTDRRKAEALNKIDELNAGMASE